MLPARAARILILAGDASEVEDVARMLRPKGHSLEVRAEPPLEALSQWHLVIVQASVALETSLQWCRQLRSSSLQGHLPLLFLTADHSPEARVASFEAGADTYLLRPFAPEELTAPVQAFLRIKEIQDRLTEKTAEVHRVNKQLQQAYQQIDNELVLAKRIQSSFLPQKLPEIPSVQFAVHYLLCNQVGGDFYDVFRLDENHVGFYVADAMGHGVPASLLTIFVKKGVRAKEVSGRQYRLVPPDEVLQKLNRDLIDQQLADHPFITMVYVLYNHTEGTIQFSRAGHPYPIYVPRDGKPTSLQQEGLLLGVFEAEYAIRTEQLHPGDKVLLFSDGIDDAQFEDCQPGTTSLLACVNHYRELPIREMISNVVRHLFADTAPSDDLTLLGIQRSEEP